VARPALLDRLPPPLAAAEAAGTAWLDGLAAGAQRPMVVVVEVSDYLWSEWNWLPGALLLTAPSARNPPAKNAEVGRRPRRFETTSRVVIVLPEVAAAALRDDRVAVPVARELSAADLGEQLAVALRDVPEGSDPRVYIRHLEVPLRALPNGVRR
jgi:hypothetical protein